MPYAVGGHTDDFLPSSASRESGQVTQESLPDEYALGRSDAETRRLILQHQLYGPLTRRFFEAAGVGTGMRVLDLGSGAGDVALLLADLVGPTGHVLGVDMNADVLTTARTRAAAAGWANVEFHVGDIRELPRTTDYDAVVGRWVLMYVPEPAQLLRQAAALLRPGGIVAFQEGVLRDAARTYPLTPLHESVLRWTTAPPGAPGPSVEMGLQLYGTFVEAGLPTPQLRLEAPLGGGPDWPGYAYVASTVRSLLPFLEQMGAVTAAEVDVDSLEERLRAEVVESGGIQQLPPVIGAWSRLTP
jgi:2-polyprenyl-3-methyl-5-hydroxy-6-metoxy-1,4-benzoquinol methylase